METNTKEANIKNGNNVTINIELLRRKNRQGLYNLYLRISQNRKHRKQKLPITVFKMDQFNPKAKHGKWISTTDPNSKQKNDFLKSQIENAYKDLQELGINGLANKETLINDLKKGNDISFTEFADERALSFYNKGSYRNYKKYNSLINKLKSFSNNKDVTFYEITLQYITSFENFLNKEKNIRKPEFKLQKNTIACHLIVFRAIVNEAIKLGKMKPEANPFIYYKPETTKTNKAKLNIEEMEIINNLDLSENSHHWHCRNYFMFSFYCAGIRAGDFCLLKWHNVTKKNRLEYTISKTTIKTSVKLFPPALEILSFYGKKGTNPENDFIFPLLSNTAPYSIAETSEEMETLPIKTKIILYNKISSMNAYINKGLKEIGETAKINKKISFHIARHSFADIMRKKNVSVYDICKLFKHSGIKITEIYMQNFDTESQDESHAKLFE